MLRITTALLLAATPALAQTDAAAPLPMTYEIFEGTVLHADLAECPAVMEAGEGVFCRLAVAGENVAVFVFSEAGDQPLVGMRNWPADALMPLLK
ncbi:hypothetical protein GI374_07405 [Paracoccus sp. S-4012]|uniref:hypothetical protein n=1 Tax=Paracoccus sp. S-4012 TaxID=2665648 RepID=UPI0012B11E5B|nr:hypothetical protein [Paracoccus sp. S-4012]MRX50275.1 hypothetical protein [Paracoccus sp. S-4012]